MRLCSAFPTLFLGALMTPFLVMAQQNPEPGPAYSRVTVGKVSTSIYIGKVTLTMPEFERHGATYTTTYSAKVIPFFFRSEKGSISINLNNADLARLRAGERVYFTGEAENTAGEPRKIEGHADPANPLSGRIKVRVFITEKIQLIFNTTYRFSGGRAAPPPLVGRASFPTGFGHKWLIRRTNPQRGGAGTRVSSGRWPCPPSGRSERGFSWV